MNKPKDTEITEYVPTPLEMRMIELMFDPVHVNSSITEKAEVLNISRNTYYKHMAKPEFQAYYIQLSKDLIKQHTGPLVNAAVKHAKAGSFQHFKYLMEFADIHKEDNKLQLEGAIEHIVTFGRSSDDDTGELPRARTIIDVEIEEIEGPEGPEES